MAIFSRRGGPSYAPLQVPSHGSFALPDVSVLSKDTETINLLIQSARENIVRLLEGWIEAPPLLRTLDSDLTPILLRHVDKVDDESASSIIRIAGTIEFAVGIMEEGGGVARSRQVEGHYWNALIFLGLESSKIAPDELALVFDLAVHAGYYVARSREDGIPMVLAVAASAYTR